MGAPNINVPKAPAPVDTTKAQIAALNYTETQRKMRQSQGRKSTFLTAGTNTQARPLNTMLGQ